MREILYIRLRPGVPGSPLPAESVEYAVATLDHPGSTAARQAPLESVLDQAAARRIVVLVPGAEVRLSSVNVPARQASKVLQAAPYLLEDQLADDVETLHFALGPRQGDGTYPVAVVARARMDQWLQPFRERGLRPEALYPEILALPWDTEQRWSALIEPDQVVVRTAAFAGFCCHPDDLASYLQLADAGRTQVLRLLVVAQTGGDYSRIDWPLELRPGYASALEAFVPNLRPDSNINLLQGAYSQRQDLERYWRPWRAAAALAAACLLLAAVTQIVQTWKLAKAVAAQEAANLERFRELFPTETRVVNLAAQLDQQLRALQGGGRRDGLLPLLETLAQAVTTNQGLKLQGLQYREGALSISLEAADLQVVERLREWFAAQPAATLEVQSVDSGAQGAQVRLRLTPR